MIRNVEPLGRAGLFVPETGTRNHKIPHHALAQEHHRRAQAGPSVLFQSLREELIGKGRPERIVLSSEEFEFSIGQTPKRRALVSYLSDLGYELRIIAYVRPQDGYLNSSYAQMTKFLSDLGSFDEYKRKAFEQVRFDYSRHLLPVFRDPDLTAAIRPFNRETLAGTIESDFLSVLGLSVEEAARVERKPPFNETPGPKTIALCAGIAARLTEDGVEFSRKQRVAAGRFIRKLTDRAGWNETKFNALTPETSSAIHLHFADSNNQFAREVWGRNWSEVFSHELSRAIVQNVYDPVADSGMGVRQFSNMTNKILRRIREDAAAPRPYRISAVSAGMRRKLRSGAA